VGASPYVSLVHQGKPWKPKQTLRLTLEFTSAVSYGWAVEQGVRT
jgi:hypothetical protein